MQGRKSRNTWSNRQIWPWSTEWSRAKTNRLLPRECTDHSKHPPPTTQEKTLHLDITRWSTPKSDWLYSLQPKMEKLCSDHELLIAKFRFKLKKVGKTTRPFRSDQIRSDQISCSVMSDSLRPHESQQVRPPGPSPTPGVHSDSRPSSQDAIQPSHPLSSSSPPVPNPSQHQSLFQWVNSSHEVAKVVEFQLQHQSFQRKPRADLLQNGLVGCPCSPRDSQASSPTSQFKSINSSALSLLHSPTLTSIHDHRKNYSLD